ncbi:chemotaxis protein CheW [Rhodoplanes sp. TEM]|uniref:Chemotaxis protein CheW n=1 Tax=Rhodoplanes tepidamans TaxID=200616 RepID=A0ABT5J6P7_RHOTP|nr:MULTISPECIES: chemotaxis protein CheW [Rhodoplanes]MDC7785122.1 chemotaxis protein CheW [Rhodoplanes tepidamans]MDC7982596.1 chemotaxis protein CheW [Rhodoplanes sp. TEM]MDQ0356612.1 purine-binding chemotaxis protein CheW [Rhodoplanes tepidamans]
MANDNNPSDQLTEYVTVMLGEQLFGLPISRVQDVFMLERLTRVPLSQPEIAGVLNLRGRIVTAIDMRRRLGLPKREDGKKPMAIGIESKGESYGLLIDTVGEVLKLDENNREPNPVNLDARLARVSAGVHRLDGQLLVVLDVDRVLDMGEAIAA